MAEYFNRRKAIVEQQMANAFMLTEYCEKWADEAERDGEMDSWAIRTASKAAGDLEYALEECLKEINRR